MRARTLLLGCLLMLAEGAFAQIPERIRLLQSGRYLQVEQMVEKEIEGDPNPPTTKLYPLCSAYGAIKRYSKLESCLARLEANIKRGDLAVIDLEEMRQSAGMILRLALSMANQDTLEQIRGTAVPDFHMMRATLASEFLDYPRAIAEVEAAIAAIPPKLTPTSAVAMRMGFLGTLAVLQAVAGRREQAQKTLEAIQRLPIVGANPGQQRAMAWGNRLTLAKVHVALGDYRKAHELVVKDSPLERNLIDAAATAIFQSILGFQGEESTWGSWDQSVAFMQSKIRFEVGELKEAREGYDKLLAQPALRGAGQMYWTALFDRGRIAAAEADMAQAIEFWKRAVEVIEEQRSTINTDAGKIGFVGDKQAVYHTLVGALIAGDRAADAFEYAERSKARALVDLLANKKDFAVAAPNADEIRKLMASAAAAELESYLRITPDEQTARRGGAKREMELIRQQAPDLASLLTVSAPPLAAIQSRLPEDEALLEYYGDEAALYAFVLTRERLQAFSLPAAGIEAEVRELRRILGNPARVGHLPAAQKLHARLIAPLAGAIGEKRSVLIVPHGILHYLPFASLHDGSGYLLDRLRIRFLPSASVILHIRARTGRPGVLAFGNPDLEDPRFDLQFAQEEAQAIAQKVPESRALVRREASVAAFRQFAAGFGTLHFATHGEFDADAPLKSALLLSPEPGSDGRLTVDTLYSTPIGADLVTLSACETGLGRIANGDEVVGLTRGFLHAGASSVIASLWKVDDRATAALMTRFYEELASRRDKRDALRAAQLSVRSQFPHPFFWAAFQITGEPAWSTQ